LNCLVTVACRNYQVSSFRCAHMMARGLAVNGCNVDFLIGGSGEFQGSDQEDCSDYQFYCLATRGEKKGSAFVHFQTLRSGIINKRWDIILLYSVGVQFLHVVSLAKQYGIKVIYVQGDQYIPLPGMLFRHRIKLKFINAINRYLSRHADLNVLTGTQLLADHFQQQAPNVPIHLCYPPIDTTLFSKGDHLGFRQRYGLKDKILIVYCGSVGSLEGVEVLIRAMRLVSKSISQAHLVIAGKLGVMDHALTEQVDYQALTENLGISSNVTFTGFLDHEEVRGLLRAADLLIMAKLDHRRNSVAAPIKLSEYLASGRPVIASTVGDIASRFKDGVELCFCHPGNSENLADKILEMIGSPEASERIAVNGQNYARNHFDYRSWGRDVLMHLQNHPVNT